MNIQKMMKQAQDMQNKMAQLQAQLEEEETEGTSGGGAVKLVLNGKNKMLRIAIDESLLKPEDKEMLEDLIIAAHNDAREKIDTNVAQRMGALTSGLGLPSGIKLPF